MSIIDERSKIYGDPVERLSTVEQVMSVLGGLSGDTWAPGQKHAVVMIVDKLTRLVVNPTHADSWVDIAGYAEIGLRANGVDKE